MTTFKYSILENILKEGRLEDLITKYSSSLPEIWVKELSKNDPSGNNKYLEWMIKETIRLEAYLNDIEAGVEKVVEAALCFHENVNRLNQKSVTEALQIDGLTPEMQKILKSPKDINVYSVETIELLCQYFEKNVSKSASRIKIYEDDRYLVVSPLTHKASCQYGAHSNWCVSTSNVTYYDQYTSDGVLVFVIDNKSTNPKKPEANSYKFAIYIKFIYYSDPYKWQFYDMEDEMVSPALIISFLSDTIFQKIKKYVEEISSATIKQKMVNEDELQKNCQFFLKKEEENDNNGKEMVYVVFFDPTNKSQINYLDKKYNENLEGEVTKESFPFLVITQPENGIPSSYHNEVSYYYTKRIANENTCKIKYSKLYEMLKEDKDELFVPEGFSLNDQEFDEIFKLFVKHFNSLNISETKREYIDNLKVGDEIIYEPRRGPRENLKVTRVAEKTLQLNNGKRLVRNYHRIDLITNKKYQIVGTSLTNETRWVRKRIV